MSLIPFPSNTQNDDLNMLNFSSPSLIRVFIRSCTSKKSLFDNRMIFGVPYLPVVSSPLLFLYLALLRDCFKYACQLVLVQSPIVGSNTLSQKISLTSLGMIVTLFPLMTSVLEVGKKMHTLRVDAADEIHAMHRYVIKSILNHIDSYSFLSLGSYASSCVCRMRRFKYVWWCLDIPSFKWSGGVM